LRIPNQVNPMKIRCTSVGAVLVILYLCAAHWTASAQPTPPADPYFVKDLGTLGGVESQAFGINEPGQTVGGAQRADGTSHAFLFNGTSLKDLGTLGGASSVATAVNRFGQVAGHSLSSAGNTKAFLYADGQLKGLGTLGGSHSAAYAINYDGDIVGSSTTTGNTATRAFLYRNGVMTRLGGTFGGTNSVATAINDQGDVAGFASTSGNASTRAFLLTGGVQINLGTLGGASEATAINYSAQVVGHSMLPSGARHAFLYSGGIMRDLGTLGGRNSDAAAINDWSQVVGSSDVAGGGTHAFLYQNGTMTDLNTLLPSSSGWVLEAATAINGSGEIVGFGRIGGRRHAFRMSPPASLVLYGFGALSQQDSNLPRNGVQVGRNVTFVTSVVAAADGVARNIVFTDTMAGPIEIRSVKTYRESGTCTVAQKTVTCRFPGLGPLTFAEEEVWVTVRVTGPGEFSHTARATADNAGPVTASEENIGIALASFTLSLATVAGGKAVSARAELTSLAPPGGAVVRITTSNATVAPVPSQLVVQLPTATRTFNIVPHVVSQPTIVTIAATYGLVTITRTLTVVPPALSRVALTHSTMIGSCQTATAKVTLTGSAPASGARVKIAASASGVVIPSSLTVPAGAMTASLNVGSRAVNAISNGTFTASYGGVSKSLNLSVRPIYLTSVVLTPSTVTGGGTVNGVARIECPAPTGGMTATLTSTNPAIAAPSATSMTFAAGTTTRGFTVRTSKVPAQLNVTIRASAHGVTKNGALTIRP
jgi:probable HAF family extracellular repeat protein